MVMPILPALETFQIALQEDQQLGNRIKTISVKRKAGEDDCDEELGNTIIIHVSPETLVSSEV